jgi:membrane protease YdiL (CAAX protease family)
MNESTDLKRTGEEIQRILRAFLPFWPYLWLIPVAIIIRTAEGPVWGYVGIPLSLIAISLLSLKVIHRESILRIAVDGTDHPIGLKRAYLAISLLFLAIPICLTLAEALTEPAFIYQVIGAPISEEMFVRMYLLGLYLKDKANDGRYKKVAFLASNVAFVLIHFVPGATYAPLLARFLYEPSMGTLGTLSQYLLELCLGSILESYAYMITGNIFTSMSIHATANAKVFEGGAALPLIIAQFVIFCSLASFLPKIQGLLRTIRERRKLSA